MRGSARDVDSVAKILRQCWFYLESKGGGLTGECMLELDLDEMRSRVVTSATQGKRDAVGR